MSAVSIDRRLETGDIARSGRTTLGGLFASEWTKLRTVRSTMWTLGLVVVLGIGLCVLATAETAAHWGGMSPIDRATFDPTQTSLIGIAFDQFAIGILGVLVLSAEYGTGTIRATFAAEPRRLRVLAAKAAVFALVALVISEVISFAAYFLGQWILAGGARHSAIGDPGALRAVVGAGLYLTVLGLFALGLASIIRHTAGAISTFIGVLLVLPLISAALPTSLRVDVQRFWPANIGNAITSLRPDAHSFSPWAGFGVLCAYCAAALVIGGLLLVRRDA